MDPAASPLRRGSEAIESATPLDAPAGPVGKAVRALTSPKPVKDALDGTWIGHAVHPLLTDVVIGSFVSANLLDLLGGDSRGAATERLLALGIAAYPATALSGASDWSDRERDDERVRRVGLVHAGANAAAVGLYTASLVARRRGDRAKGKLLALAGAAVLGAGGYLGGHMAYVQGVGVEPAPEPHQPSPRGP
jgi:uncharacterized membrane protein